MRPRIPIAAIVLCAGRGRRMKAQRLPKVCFPIAGRPAIHHMLERLEGWGASPIILVVGHMAGTVVDTVGPSFPGVHFAYQAELRGTGHATRQGAAILRGLRFDGAILVVAGDKAVEPRALKRLEQAFRESQADVALLVAPKGRWPNAGRIITSEDGRVLKIVERADLDAARVEGRTIEIGGTPRTADEIESNVKWVNQAVYLYKAGVLFEALDKLRPANVQNEEYLTDTIDHAVRAGLRVTPVALEDPEDVLGFNDPEELLAIEDHFRRGSMVEVEPAPEADAAVFRPPWEWAAALSKPDAGTQRMLREVYGTDAALCEAKRRRLLSAVELFIERFGREGRVAIVRAPGRVNLMGRHIDHRGGCVNLMAIDREHILVARERGDTLVRARNADADRFEDLEFAVGDLLRQVQLDDWREFVNSEVVQRLVRDLQGDWGNYLKAPFLRLQQRFQDRRVHGVDCVVSGDIPMAAGLSSSSALVVAMAEALVLTNRLDVSPNDLVDLCGEGEWFVGTRGGSADHAAVKLSQSRQVAHVGFFPFEIKAFVPFPADYSVIVCDSRIQARKAAGAREVFNERIASYELAVAWVKKHFSAYAPLIHHLRDINEATLGVGRAEIYRIVRSVPESLTPDEAVATLGAEAVARVAASHTAPRRYFLRGRLLFGLAECERSKRCLSCLQSGDMAELGRLMTLSHEGDRVSGAARAAHAAENDAAAQEAPLYLQPGAYACSIPEIDAMVDLALDTPGVLGAQLAGAGLGGCMMVLAHREVSQQVIDRMNAGYYDPRGLEPGASVVTAVAGSGALRFPG